VPGRRLMMELGDERTTLHRWLTFHREGVIAKVEDLGPEPLHRQLVVSGTTLGGIVHHLTAVEHGWFEVAFCGRERREQPPLAPDADGAAVVAAYREAIARSDEILATCHDLEQRAAVRTYGPREPMTMRWILSHMVQETARHAGHVDILRELVDGTVGL